MKFIHASKTVKNIRHLVTGAVVVFAAVYFCHVIFSDSTMAANVSLTVNNTNTVLEMYIPASVTLNLLPSSGRAFDVQTLPIWIGTNSGAGYTLKMQTNSASLTRISSITDREGNKTFPTIAPMTTVGSTTGYTEEQFMSDSSDSDTLNRWGYKLSTNTNYIPITTNEITLSSTNAPSNGTNIGVDFAAKIDASQPTGLYATTLNFVAVTNNTNTAFTINFDGNGLHFGDDPNNTVNVVTYDATRTSSQAASYSCSDNFSTGISCLDDNAPNYYSYYSYNTHDNTTSSPIPVSLNPSESTTVTLKYGLGSHEEDGVVYPDYLFVLNGYYENDSTISDTLYNVLVNVCNQDVNCAKERMALRNVELIDVFSGSAVGGDATVPITTSFGIDAANTSGLLPTLDPSNSSSLPVTNSGITFVIAGFEQSTSNAYGYHATIKQTGNWVDGLEKTVISGAYAEPVASRGVTEFLGWSEDPVATVPTYRNEGDVEARLEAVNGDTPVTLYAVYLQTDIEMQELTPSLCTAAGTYVYDNRDNKIYLVRRLPDNRCWMLDNLALDLSDLNIQQELSTTNTNADDHSLQCLISGEYNGSHCSSPYATARVANWSSSDSYTEPLVATSGQCDDNDDCANDPSLGYWSADSIVYPTFGDGNHKIGIYYNYCAASAGSYCYAAGDGSSNATQDICPKGWHIPTGREYTDGTSEYWDLWAAYLSGVGRDYFGDGISVVYSGCFSGGVAMDLGRYGEWWSSTYANGSSMYYNGSNRSFAAYAQHYADRSGEGATIRCVLAES